MASENGQAAPASAANTTPQSPATNEPSDDELASILAGGAPAGEHDGRIPDGDDGGDDSPDQDAGGEGVDDEDPDADDDSGQDDDGDEPDGETQAGDEDGDETPDDGAGADAAEDPDAKLDDEAAAIRAKFTPEQQKLFDRAVAKKARRIIELRTQAGKLQADLQKERERKVVPLASTADNPLADVEDEAALDQRLSDARALRAWARRNPQGGFIKNGDKEIEITAERAAEMLDEADAVIEEHGPKRREFIRQRAAAETSAAAVYPWLKDKNNRNTVVIESWLRETPQLRALPIPNLKLALADMLVGICLRTKAAAEKKPAGKAAAKDGAATAAARKVAPKAPAAPAGGTRAPRVSAATKAAGGAIKKLEDTGEDPDDAALGAILNGG